MKAKKVLAFLLAAVMVIGLLAGCGGSQKDEKTEDGKFIYRISMVNPKEDLTSDPVYQFISDKFGVVFEPVGVSYENWSEKNNIWLSSGDMPDIMKWSFNYKDYMNFADQGIVRALPDDLETKYPNVAAVMKNNKTWDKLKESNDGKIYTFIPSYGFGTNVYEEGFDVNVDMYGFVYRKDWAEQLGIEFSTVMPYEDLMAAAKKFKEADLGGVGKDNVVGMAVHYTEAPNVFVTAYNSCYNMFRKNADGEYVYGMTQPVTKQGVMEYAKAYKEGILHPNFFAHKLDNVKSLFVTGKAGIYYENWTGTNAFKNFKKLFEESNPGLDADKVLGMCWFTSPDGKIHGRENTDFWECSYYNPDMSDEKFDKLLSVMDYIAGHDGAMLKNYGLEGVDYKVEGDTVTRLIPPTNEEGGYKMVDKYPSIGIFNSLISSSFSDKKFIPRDGLDMESMKTLNELGLAKLGGDRALSDVDLDVQFYSSDTLSKFNANVKTHEILLDVVMAENPEAEWEKQLAAFKDDAAALEKELNDALK
ncbi:MAG: hypothetical protein E7400_01020 [Ruminococcaceae bacterium]|nr:hypothetical protein [Oscillospiraceae bacterium]